MLHCAVQSLNQERQIPSSSALPPPCRYSQLSLGLVPMGFRSGLKIPIEALWVVQMMSAGIHKEIYWP